MDHLFIGGIVTSKNPIVFDHLKIQCVVNLTPQNETILNNRTTENYLHFNVEDSSTQNMREVFEKGLPFLEHAITNGQNVLVHCHQGRSRSGVLVVAYVMKVYNLGYEDALQFVQKSRLGVRPNEGFKRQIIEYL